MGKTMSTAGNLSDQYIGYVLAQLIKQLVMDGCVAGN